MEQPRLYRKRFIPEETVYLKDDVVTFVNDEIVVTRWKVLKPRNDFAKGCSCYFLKKGYKVSRFMDKNNRLVYYYCDIIDTKYDANENTYLFSDLLADVIIYENGFIKVVDVGEIAQAQEMGLISLDLMKKALLRLDALLEELYAGKLSNLIQYLD